MKDIIITTEEIKLGSFLKLIGEAESGGDAKNFINSQKVIVDGKICLERGKKLIPGQTVEICERKYRVVSE